MKDPYAAGGADWPAELQDGVLTRSQALTAGVTAKVIAKRLQQGRWQRLHPGVYATFNGPPSWNCQLWAAVLRAGPDSALSHQTAAQLWGLTAQTGQAAQAGLARQAGPATQAGLAAQAGLATPAGLVASADAIHVTVPSGSQVARIPGVVLHYSGRVGQARHPMLTPPRTRAEETVLDLAAAASTADDAIAWVLRACAGRRTTADRIVAAMNGRRRLRWRPELSLALDPVNSGVHSLLEFRYVIRVERPHGLPPGRRQQLVMRGTRRQYSDVDYDGYATIVELDGRAAHPESSRLLDTRRDNANVADGQVTLRYGWAEVSERSCEVAAQVASALRQQGWPGKLRRCGSTCRLIADPRRGRSAAP
jgi:hypothetical protein